LLDVRSSISSLSVLVSASKGHFKRMLLHTPRFLCVRLSKLGTVRLLLGVTLLKLPPYTTVVERTLLQSVVPANRARMHFPGPLSVRLLH
jgi:hypothetical protein